MGLEFINALRPVSYTMDYDNLSKKLEEPKEIRNTHKKRNPERQVGFIAQEVEQVVKALGMDFDGVDLPQNNDDLYGLKYSTFVVPLVKSVQELSESNDNLAAQNENLQMQITELKKNYDDVEKLMAQLINTVNDLEKEIN